MGIVQRYKQQQEAAKYCQQNLEAMRQAADQEQRMNALMNQSPYKSDEDLVKYVLGVLLAKAKERAYNPSGMECVESLECIDLDVLETIIKKLSE